MTQENTNGDTRSAAPSAQDRPQIPQHEVSIADLSKKILATDKQYDLSKILSAYQLAEKAHADQKRSSGEPYIIHPLAVADILLDLGMDTDTICVGLLHDVVEDTNYTLDDIRKKFGQDVAMLVDGVTKLNRIPIFDKEQQQAENVRKILLAMSHDIRVMIIKLADRIHNMRTLKFLPPEKQRRIALETMNVYAPIAHRLGIRTVKEELEDLSFYYLDSYAYSEIEHIMEIKKDEREKFIDSIKERIRKRLEKEHFAKEPIIEGRVKSIYGIYKKVYVNHKSMDEIYDKYAVRVIVSTVAECYMVLGIVHDMYKPVPGRFKDYIAMPKPNMYQSLHTTLMSSVGQPFEIQIRTEEMHKTAEYGIAAHWKYKESGGSAKNNKSREEEKLSWLRQILEWQRDMSDNREFLSLLKGDLDLFAEDVYCFTPNGDVKNLPNGSTPVDFAYAIHSAVGNKMVGARVNGKLVNIDYKIQNGDRIEILTSQNSKGPSRDWLSIVKSTQAKNKINQWFRTQFKEENILRGKELLTNYCKAQGIVLTDLVKPEYTQACMKKYGFRDWDSVLAALGHGGLKEGQVINKLQDAYRKKNPQFATDKDILEAVGKNNASSNGQTGAMAAIKSKSGIVVAGLDDVSVRFSRCCSPVPGDEIIGFVTRGRGVSIHRTDCVNVMNMNEADRQRIIEAEWQVTPDKEENELYDTELVIYAYDRIGVLLDLTKVFTESGITINNVNSRTSKQGIATITIGFAIRSVEALHVLTAKLRQVESVKDIQRTHS